MRGRVTLNKFRWVLAPLLVVTFFVHAEQTTSGTPTEDDYQFFCKNYGSRGTALRDQCEARLRAGRGLLECRADSWLVSCSVDSMTDKNQCNVTNRHVKGGLFVFVQGGDVSFMVVGDDYPGEPMSIRVDQNKAISFDDELHSAQAKALLSQIKGGTTLQTRMVLWPTGIFWNTKAPICDLPEKIEAALQQAQ